jgi:hypothetical protein
MNNALGIDTADVPESNDEEIGGQEALRDEREICLTMHIPLSGAPLGKVDAGDVVEHGGVLFELFDERQGPVDLARPLSHGGSYRIVRRRIFFDWLNEALPDKRLEEGLSVDWRWWPRSQVPPT